MDLYIVRHAEASNQAGDDRERPLTDRGREQARNLGAKIAAVVGPLSEMRHSTRRRARETAEIIASLLEDVPPVHASSGLEPEDDPVLIIEELEEEPRALMVVGHLPFVARLAVTLAGASGNVPFEPATMVHLQFDGDQWRLLRILKG